MTLVPEKASFAPEEVPSEPVGSLQREVQRKLGRCMIRLQQYERLVKALAIVFDLAGPSDELENIQLKRTEAMSKLTLGQLVKELTGTYLQPQQPETAQPAWNPGDPRRIWFRFQARMTLDQADYDQTVNELTDLVAMRNELVHHFLERFDVWSVLGCQGADAYLDSAMSKVDAHYARLRHWALSMDEGRQMMGAFLQAPPVPTSCSTASTRMAQSTGPVVASCAVCERSRRRCLSMVGPISIKSSRR